MSYTITAPDIIPQFGKGERVYIKTYWGVICRFVDGIIIRDTGEGMGVIYHVMIVPGKRPLAIEQHYCWATEADAQKCVCNYTFSALDIVQMSGNIENFVQNLFAR